MTSASEDLPAPETAISALTELLRHVVGVAARSVPDVHGVGLAVFGSEAVQHLFVAATNDLGAEHLDSVQSTELGEGPSVLAVQQRDIVTSGSVADDERWPRFGPRAGQVGARSVLVAPLLLGDAAVGTLTCWSRLPDAFDASAQQNIAGLAAWAAASVDGSRGLERAWLQAQQLQAALVSRATIDQAIGILRSRTGGGADEAFNTLRDISQRENVKLALIAERLVEEAVRRARARHAHG